ncbi:ubiquitin-conjugating enzyme family protein [Humisphaera borealis]|uniref:UBC core domain-containing protein n=1 Tax=Humisphaera borealis TaxID=2807512 RepID=A0A7M2WVS2_9BACT|nr:hypothetical protein [Humisphaera borealis]QOV88580.1 hypothetical protein IPV69_20395 [Humisphaera borealis]
MWNNPQDDAYGQTPPQVGGDPYAEVTWSSDQLARMENEWRRLQRAFAYHPHVTLSPLEGDPPSSYQVDFRLTTVIVNPRTSQLEYVANASVQIALPPGFPNQAPVVKPMTAIFHPNVSYEGLYLEGLWHPNETLLGLIRKVGDVLAYRSYDPDYAVNPAAMEWLTANHSILPIDGQANLSPQAGGEPLERICKYGPQSLESMKQSILATQSSLFGNSAPDPLTLRNYANKTRLALNLFMENDVPEHLQSVASDLDEAARELVSMSPLYDYVRERRRRIAALRQAVKSLAAAKAPLTGEIDKLAGLVPAADPDEPMAALKLIPPAAKLQPLQFSMPKMIDDAEKKFAAIRSAVEAVEKQMPPSLIPTDSMLGKRLDREINSGESDAAGAKKEAAATLADFEPVLNRAGSEASALEVAVRWREYMDMAEKARLIERLIRQNGAEGIHAYYIERQGSRFGPYQFEQSVDLGAGELLIRNNSGKTIELWDHKRDKPLTTNANGAMLVALPAPPPGPDEEVEVDEHGQPVKRTIPTKFLMTDRCDDLVVLLEYLRRSTIETVQKFAAYNGDSQSWAGKVCRVLSRPEVKKSMEEELAGAARRWRHIIVDLAALSTWKERLATYFLLHRCSATIPQLVATINDCKQKHAASKKKVADIMSKSGRDTETGNMVVPPKYSRSYQEEMKLQETCATTARVSTVRLKSLAAQLSYRLQDPKRLGKGKAPTLRALPPLPETLAHLPLADGHLGNMIAPLEELIQAPLGGPPPEAPEQQEAAYEQPAEGYAEEGYAAPGEYADQAVEGYEQPEAAEQGQYDPEPQYAVESPHAPEAQYADGQPYPEVSEVEPSGLAPAEVAGHPAAEAANPESPYEALPGEVGQESVVHDQWVIQEDDDTATYAEDAYEQSDIAFGFEPDPGPPGGKTAK